MSFLAKDEKTGEYISVISEQCNVQGTLDLQGSLRIDGHLEGNVNNAKFVTISNTGYVKGDITGKGVVVIGEMIGDICADKVEILATAKINGDIRTKSILIEGGAKVTASIKVVSEEEQVAQGELIEPKKAINKKEENKKESK